MWLDSLVMAHVGLTEGVNASRAMMPDRDHRDRLERACDQIEQRFMQARDHVRASRSFQKLGPGDQERIKSILFELFPPTASPGGGSGA